MSQHLDLSTEYMLSLLFNYSLTAFISPPQQSLNRIQSQFHACTHQDRSSAQAKKMSQQKYAIQDGQLMDDTCWTTLASTLFHIHAWVDLLSQQPHVNTDELWGLEEEEEEDKNRLASTLSFASLKLLKNGASERSRTSAIFLHCRDMCTYVLWAKHGLRKYARTYARAHALT